MTSNTVRVVDREEAYAALLVVAEYVGRRLGEQFRANDPWGPYTQARMGDALAALTSLVSGTMTDEQARV